MNRYEDIFRSVRVGSSELVTWDTPECTVLVYKELQLMIERGKSCLQGGGIEYT